MSLSSRGPFWVAALLEHPVTWPALRVALTCAYWISGVTKLLDFHAALMEQAHFGLHPAWLFAGLTIAVQLLGSVLIVIGRWVWLGAGALAVFTVVATLIAHAFWRVEGPERAFAVNTFFEHIGLIAGLLITARLAAREESSALAACRSDTCG